MFAGLSAFPKIFESPGHDDIATAGRTKRALVKGARKGTGRGHATGNNDGTEGEGHDRMDIKLPAGQIAVANAVRQHQNTTSLSFSKILHVIRPKYQYSQQS